MFEHGVVSQGLKKLSYVGFAFIVYTKLVSSSILLLYWMNICCKGGLLGLGVMSVSLPFLCLIHFMRHVKCLGHSHSFPRPPSSFFFVPPWCVCAFGVVFWLDVGPFLFLPFPCLMGALRITFLYTWWEQCF